MLTFNVVLGYKGLLFRDFLWFFFVGFFFSIRPTDPISGNEFDGKRRKKGDGLKEGKTGQHHPPFEGQPRCFVGRQHERFIWERQRHCRGVVFAKLTWLSRVNGRSGTWRGQRVIEEITDDNERPPGIGESLFTFLPHNICSSLPDEADKT